MADDRRVDVGAVMRSGRLSFRAFRQGDEAAILRILNQNSDHECSLDQWAWLFPPDADGRAIVVGERDGQVDAVCGGVPVRIVIDGRESSGVGLRRLVSRDREEAARALESFVEIFGSGDRFVMAMAPFAFDGAVRAPLATLRRVHPTRVSPRRLLYRAEPARDWEPRLDALWERVQSSYPATVVRNADHALGRFAGHPSVRHHRFLVFPRYSRHAAAFVVFADDGSTCRWLDLVWDHGHPGAVDLVAHISARLAAEWGSRGEEFQMAGDDRAVGLLLRRGFRSQSSSSPVVAVRSFRSEIDAAGFADRAYFTAADLAELDS